MLRRNKLGFTAAGSLVALVVAVVLLIWPSVKVYFAKEAWERRSGVAIGTFSDETVENLTVLGKIWGFLKYYHPKIAKGDYNWDYELFRVMAQVASAASINERNSILSQWVNQLGPVNVSANGQDSDSAQAKMLPDLKWIEDKARLGEKLAEQLAQVRNADRTPTHYYIDLAPGVGNPIFKNEKGYNSMAYPDVGYRLLALYRYWNMIQYFYPYKYLIGEDWNSVLTEFVSKFISAKDELAYKLVLLELIARVHDTHANISQRDEVLAAFKGTNRAALKVGIVQGKAVVTDYLNTELGEATGLKKGDVILSVNDKMIEAIIQERLPRTPASNHPTQLARLAADLLRSNDGSLMVSYEREGRTQSTSIECVADKGKRWEFDLDEYLWAKSQQRESGWELLTKEIGYLYPGSIKNADLPKIMLAFKNTKGIIIDLRCYPSEFIVFTLSEYLLPEGKDFVKFTTGSISQPGLFSFTSNLKVGRKKPNYYKGKIVILVNETTLSQAEYTTMALRVAPQAIVLGSTTAAADGNVSEIILPGGIRTFITGIGVYYPDGTETQRVGIVPDIELKPTIQGIKDNRDELLEKAKELINAAG